MYKCNYPGIQGVKCKDNCCISCDHYKSCGATCLALRKYNNGKFGCVYLVEPDLLNKGIENERKK